MWAAEADADVRTTIEPARLKGANPLDVNVGVLEQQWRGLQNPISWGG